MDSAEPQSAQGPLITDEFLRFLTRHLVGLAWTDVLADEFYETNPQSLEAFCETGFVIEIRGHWFWVTAGHMLHDLQARLGRNRRIMHAWLLDGLHRKHRNGEWLPFPLEWAFESKACHHLWKEAEGLDYGIIHLSELFRANLQAAGVEPLTEVHWTDVPAATSPNFVLGLPNDDKSFPRVPTSQGFVIHPKMTLAIFNVEQVFDPPECLIKPTDRFYARVHLDQPLGGIAAPPLKSIEGLSGGPVFGFKPNAAGEWQYWAIGIQSGWAADSRVLAACPLSLLCQELARVISGAGRPAA
jgi:hypothetical protein